MNYFILAIILVCFIAGRVCSILDRREMELRYQQLRQDNRDNNAGWHQLVEVERSRLLHPSSRRPLVRDIDPDERF